MTQNTSINQWRSVVGQNGHVYVIQKSGMLPPAEKGQARVRMVASSICGADLRIVSGDKDAHVRGGAPVVLGHEGCGYVEEVVYSSSRVRAGDYVVVLPHIHSPERANGCPQATTTILASCTSRKHTTHAGWDFDGTFSDLGVFPEENLVIVTPEQIRRAEQLAPDLGRAIFTITEPLLCVLSAYTLIERETNRLQGQDLTPGRALVIGCGSIGILHSILLSERGYQVTFSDPVQQRVQLAQHCLGSGQSLNVDQGEFDLIVVTANVLPAIRQAEGLVKDGGVIYLFSGMNASDRQAKHPDGVFSYEDMHRAAHGVLTYTNNKKILYIGHSGYYAHLAPKAVATVSANANRLSHLLTGVVHGWFDPTIQSRTEGVCDWQTDDGTPAITAILQKRVPMQQHGKIFVLANEGR